MGSACRLSTNVIRLSKSITKHSLRSFLHCAECVFLAPSGSAKFIAFWCKKNRRATKLKKIEQAEDIAGLRIIVGSGTNQEAILLAWNDENVKKGLQPFTPVYTKDDAAQTLALQSGRADAYFGPNVIGAWKAALNGKTQRVGSVDGGWPKAAHIAVTLKKDSGLVLPVQTALNGVIGNGDYDKVLNRWGEGVERIPQSEINPAGLGD